MKKIVKIHSKHNSYLLLFVSTSAIFFWNATKFPRRNITKGTIWGSILDLFQSINIFALLNILSNEADNVWTAKYCLAIAARFGNRCWLSFHKRWYLSYKNVNSTWYNCYYMKQYFLVAKYNKDTNHVRNIIQLIINVRKGFNNFFVITWIYETVFFILVLSDIGKWLNYGHLQDWAPNIWPPKIPFHVITFVPGWIYIVGYQILLLIFPMGWKTIILVLSDTGNCLSLTNFKSISWLDSKESAPEYVSLLS